LAVIAIYVVTFVFFKEIDHNDRTKFRNLKRQFKAPNDQKRQVAEQI